MPFKRTTSVDVLHASVRQSKMHATASSGNSISHPTEQSKHFDTQFGFFLLTNLTSICWLAFDAVATLDDEALEVPFEVDAP
jgi:hypothetical protein